MTTLIRNGTLLTPVSTSGYMRGDLLIENERISKIAKKIDLDELQKKHPRVSVIDASNQFVIPGFVQAHTHLCQVLFRGYADDLPLLEWLKKRIWPMESSHTDESLQVSSELGLLEMQLAGTTTILDMGTVQNTDAIFSAVQKSGMRYWGGKCLMDNKQLSGPLYEERKKSLADMELLIKRWHQSTPLINYAICPRFAVSCTRQMLKDCVEIQNEKNLIIHTHASESKDEIKLVKKLSGLLNIDYLNSLGMLSPRSVIVHGVHVTKGELKKLLKTQTPLVHCPGSNLKLGSGFAPIEMYLNEGLNVALGSDGAPCNNTMDPFIETRLAALLQKPLFGPDALSAERAFNMATINGARALGCENDFGSLEEGKFADVVVVDRSHPSVQTVENPFSAIVYSCTGRDVTHVIIHGDLIVKNREHLKLDREKITQDAQVHLERILRKI